MSDLFQGECTFEAQGFCGWQSKQSQLNGITAQFLRATGNSRLFVSGSKHPLVDHTTGTANGEFYIFYTKTILFM